MVVTHNAHLAERADRLLRMEAGVLVSGRQRAVVWRMTCQQCDEREAVVLLKKVEGGEVRVLHLCEKCAAERGVPGG